MGSVYSSPRNTNLGDARSILNCNMNIGFSVVGNIYIEEVNHECARHCRKEEKTRRTRCKHAKMQSMLNQYCPEKDERTAMRIARET